MSVSVLILHHEEANIPSSLEIKMKKLLLFLLVMVGAIGCRAQQTAGYRGGADLGYTIGVGDYDFGRFEISTTQGYQVNPYFFVGAGLGFHFMESYHTKDMLVPLDERKAKVSIPLFADFRGTFSKRKFAPFVDLKLGYFVTNNDGFYGNIAVGCRMMTKGKHGVNLSIGYTYENLEFETFHRFISNMSLDYERLPRKESCEGVSIKVGYEF